MSAKNVFLIALLALVGVVYYYEYRDSFRNREIKVYVTMRPKIPMRGPLDVEHPPEDMVVLLVKQVPPLPTQPVIVHTVHHVHVTCEVLVKKILDITKD